MYIYTIIYNYHRLVFGDTFCLVCLAETFIVISMGRLQTKSNSPSRNMTEYDVLI